MTSRTYTGGLPVSITVYDDGTVEFTVHVEDACDMVAEVVEDNAEEGTFDPDVAVEDGRRVDSWLDTHNTDLRGVPTLRIV